MLFGFSMDDMQLRWVDFNIPLHMTAQLTGSYSPEDWSSANAWLAVAVTMTIVYILVQVGCHLLCLNAGPPWVVAQIMLRRMPQKHI